VYKSEYEVAGSVAGNSDEGIVPFDVGVTSDVGKGLWGVRDETKFAPGRTQIRSDGSVNDESYAEDKPESRTRYVAGT